jgi:serine/threonine protein kinase
VLPLQGIVYNEKDTGLFAVSPWMPNGTAIDFVKKHPHPNVPKMLSEIAEGMNQPFPSHRTMGADYCLRPPIGLAYLHSRQILHGDIRGVSESLAYDFRLLNLFCLQVNILISGNYVARLSDFGLSRRVDVRLLFHQRDLHYLCVSSAKKRSPVHR